MRYEEVMLDAFSIVGISVRTSNHDGKAIADLGKLWSDFMNSSAADDINNRLSDDIYCMYTDYESDKDGEYTAILGFKVSNTNDITGEYTYKDIPASKYYKFIAEGEFPESVAKTWHYIWQSVNTNRRYLVDFEVYEPSSYNDKKARVPIYISVQ